MFLGTYTPKLADKGRMGAEAAAAASERLVPVEQLADLADAALVVEAIVVKLIGVIIIVDVVFVVVVVIVRVVVIIAGNAFDDVSFAIIILQRSALLVGQACEVFIFHTHELLLLWLGGN